MGTKKIFYLLVLFLLCSNAASALVRSINKNTAPETTVIKAKGRNLLGATACFQLLDLALVKLTV